VVGFAALDGGYSVELLEEDDECELMLEGQWGERPDEVRIVAQVLSVPVRGSDKVAGTLDAPHFPLVDFFGELGGGERFASLVHHDAERALADGSVSGGNIFAGAVFDVFELVGAVALESLEVFGDACFGITERRFSCGDDLVFHGVWCFF